MIYETIPGLNKRVSRIAFGCSCHPMERGELTMLDHLDYLYDELGITLFDNAYAYQKSESVLGEWMAKRGNRDNVVVISKGCCLAPGMRRVTKEILQKQVEESLTNLKTDCIDIYYLHRDDPKVTAEELVEMLNDLRKQGKIKVIGVSNWTTKRIDQANAYAEAHGLEKISISSPSFSLARQIIDPWGGGRGCVCLSRDYESMDYYREKGIIVAPYSAMARGFLAGRFPSNQRFALWKSLDWASRIAYFHKENFRVLKVAEDMAKKKGCTLSQLNLAYVLQQDFMTFPVISSTKKDRMKDNLKAFDITLAKEEIDELNNAAKK